jgi:hypothetical protein
MLPNREIRRSNPGPSPGWTAASPHWKRTLATPALAARSVACAISAAEMSRPSLAVGRDQSARGDRRRAAAAADVDDAFAGPQIGLFQKGQSDRGDHALEGVDVSQPARTHFTRPVFRGIGDRGRNHDGSIERVLETVGM